MDATTLLRHLKTMTFLLLQIIIVPFLQRLNDKQKRLYLIVLVFKSIKNMQLLKIFCNL